MSTELAISNGAAAPSIYSPQQRELIRNSVAQGATDLELDYFLALAQSTGLNPFRKEIWFIKSKGYENKRGEQVAGRVQIMTGIDGFYRIANDNPQYDGIEREYGADVEIPISASKAPHIKSIMAPEWVETKAFRKDRSRPQIARAYWREYAQELVTYGGQLSLWAQKPRVMLEKCADATALRKAFPQQLGHFYAPEEVPREYSADDEDRKSTAEIEADQRRHYLKQQAEALQRGEYVIEHGSKKGQPLAKASNSIWLEKHLEKYRSQLRAEAIAAISVRINELKREYARKQEALRVDAAQDGWTPSPEEEAEILKREMEEAQQ